MTDNPDCCCLCSGVDAPLPDGPVDGTDAAEIGPGSRGQLQGGRGYGPSEQPDPGTATLQCQDAVRTTPAIHKLCSSVSLNIIKLCLNFKTCIRQVHLRFNMI